MLELAPPSSLLSLLEFIYSSSNFLVTLNFAQRWLDATFSWPLLRWQFLLSLGSGEGPGFFLTGCWRWKCNCRDDAMVFMDTDGFVAWKAPFLVFPVRCTLLFDAFSACRRHFPHPLPVETGHSNLSLSCFTEPFCRMTGMDRFGQPDNCFLGAILSFLAIMQASLLRLLLRGCPLRGGVRNADPLIRTGRYVVQGAPLRFWLVFAVITSLPVVHGVRLSGSSGPHPFVGVDTSDDRVTELHHHIDRVSLLHQDFADRWIGQRVFPAFARPEQLVEDDAAVDEAEPVAALRGPAVRTPVRVLRFQRTELFISLLLEPETSTEEVLERATSVLLGSESHYFLEEACPQPDDDCITLLLSPVWWHRQNFVPVVVDRSPWRRSLYMATLPRHATFREVRAIVYPMLADGMAITIENAWSPLESGDEARPTSGGLVRVAPHSDHLPPLMDLEASMRNLDWVSDVDEYGLPPQRSPAGKLLVITPDHRVLLTTTSELCIPRVHRQLATLLRADINEVYLVWPRPDDLDAIEYKGQPAMGAVAAFLLDDCPTHGNGCGIFIDARDLACNITFAFFDDRYITVDEILLRINFVVPTGLIPCVEGFDDYIAENETFFFVTGATATIWLAVPDERVIPEASAFRGSEELHSGPDEHRPSDQGRSTLMGFSRSSHSPVLIGRAGRSRSPRGLPPPELHDDLANLPTLLEASSVTADGIQALETVANLWESNKHGAANPRAFDVRRPVATPCRNENCFPWPCAEPVRADMTPVSNSACTPVSCISIADSIGATGFDVAKHCVDIMTPGDVDAFWDLIKPWEAGSLALDLTALELHPSTSAALDSLQSFRPDGFPLALDFYTDGSAKDDTASYAVVVLARWQSAQELQLLGGFGGPVLLDDREFLFVGANTLDAFTGELTALLWAALWCLGHWSALGAPKISFHFDAVHAGFASSGIWGCHEHPVGQKARAVMRLLEQLVGVANLEWLHVKSHSGEPWNELADSLATRCRESVNSAVPAPKVAWHFRIVDVNLEWLPLVPLSIRTGSVPFPAYGRLTWEESGSPLTILQPTQLIPTVELPDGGAVRLCVRAMTANIQSGVGKVKFLEEQLEAKGVNVFMCQESKGKEGLIRSRSFLRFATDSQRHWGVEIWLHRHQPICVFDGRAVHVGECDCGVLSAGPRHLHLVVKTAGFQLHLASLHIPQQNAGDAERLKMIRVLQDIAETAGTHWCIMGVDANARVPQNIEGTTGEVSCGECDAAGQFFVSCLQEQRLWLPTTFADIHSGSSATWTHAGGKTSRIDFFVLNSQFEHASISTSVCHDFDMLNARDDHFAIQLSLEQLVWAEVKGARRLKRGSELDFKALEDPVIRCSFEKQLDSLRLDCIPWQTDVNLHAHWLSHGIQEALSAVLPSRDAVPRSNYIPEQAWTLRRRKIELKRITSCRSRSFKPFVRMCVLRLLRGWYRDKIRGVWSSLRKAVLLHEVFASAIQIATASMRKLIRNRKSELLAKLGDGLGAMRPDAILAQLKSMCLGKRKVAPWKKTLPVLVDSDHKPVAGRSQRDDLWLQYFGEMEMGSVKDTARFLQEANVQMHHFHGFDPDPLAFPTLSEVETVFRRTKAGKSVGHDAVPGEALRKAPSRMTAAFFPLMFKTAATLKQCVQWRGGILTEAYKQSGLVSDVTSYRSLFISSMPGKAYHRILRSKIIKNADNMLADTHFGARAGASVVIPSQIVVLFQKWQKHIKCACAVIYLDTKSAYYRVVRQFAYGDERAQEWDSATQRVMRHFQLPESDWADLVALVRNGGIMAEAGIGPHLRCLIADAHDHSWFTTKYADGHKLCHTRAGSRPGESLADVVYAFVLHKVLLRVRRQVEEAGFAVEVPFSGDKTLTAEHADAHVSLDGPVWADDATFLCSDPAPDRMVAKVKSMMACILDACRSHGMAPNLKRGKTGITLCIRGKGCRKVQADIFGRGSESISVRTSLGDEEVFLMPTYVHLGCAVDRDMSFETEAYRRVGSATSAFNTYRSLLFQNKAVSMQTRGQLLAVLVESTFFNAELWCPDKEKGFKLLERGFSRLLRRMLARDIETDEYNSLCEAEIVILTEHPPIKILMRSRRLRYLIGFIRAAPEVLWALVQAERDWGAQLWEDLAWLRNQIGSSLPAANESCWPLWWHFIQDHPGQYAAAVRKATRRDTLAFALNGLRAHHEKALTRRVCREFPGSHVCSVEAHWICVPCRKRFRNKCNLSCHFFRSHGRIAAHRLYAGGTICPSCRKQFHDCFRVQRHLQSNATCWKFVVDHGFCGAERQHSRGSQAWKRHRLEQPILCPPLPSGIAEPFAPQVFNNNCNPAQPDIDKLASRIGESLEDALLRGEAGLTSGALWKLLEVSPLFPEEYREALGQAAADLRLCVSEGVISAPARNLEAALAWLQDAQAYISGDSISLHVFGAAVEMEDGFRLREERVPCLRQALCDRFVQPAILAVRGSALFPEEMTHLESLASDLACKLTFQRSCVRVEDLPLDHMIVLVFHTEGEVAASCVAAETSFSAALEGDRDFFSFPGFRSLRLLLIQWRSMWERFLRGSSACCICNGPLWWADVVRGLLSAQVAVWDLKVLSSSWVLRASSAASLFAPS